MLQVAIHSFSYTEKEILSEINFHLHKGSHLAVLGESGCGKSTLLHLIYGLLHLENGDLQWGDKKLLGPKFNLVPGEDFIKLVAQEFNVMPFISVAENIATHLPRLDLKADHKRVQELLSVVDMEPYANVMVKNLSGGQKQRVALAKALAKKPELLLLDEPFSNVDVFRKNTLRRKLFSYLKSNHITCITATHDAEEALAFSDIILLLKDGKMERFTSPENLYHSFKNSYQASFFGEVSLIPAGILSAEEKILLPHQLTVSESKTALQVEVTQSYFKGKYYIVEAIYNNITTLFFESDVSINSGTKVYLQLVNC
ncbi:MAG: ABC transporter ATP-binding protein [Flavobacteriaceae bacterium]|nr:ABC transporter ATP-binding protein [Flavobacteriaceae bacterium]